MRIAISGSHFTGKSTLIEALSKKLPNYLVVEEPYFLIEGEGYIFSDPPGVQDFRQQFDRSTSLINESESDTIFDRCPLDFIAYALTIKSDIDLESWIEELEGPLEQLDLIVFYLLNTKIKFLFHPQKTKN